MFYWNCFACGYNIVWLIKKIKIHLINVSAKEISYLKYLERRAGVSIQKSDPFQNALISIRWHVIEECFFELQIAWSSVLSIEMSICFLLGLLLWDISTYYFGRNDSGNFVVLVSTCPLRFTLERLPWKVKSLKITSRCICIGVFSGLTAFLFYQNAGCIIIYICIYINSRNLILNLIEVYIYGVPTYLY